MIEKINKILTYPPNITFDCGGCGVDNTNDMKKLWNKILRREKENCKYYLKEPTARNGMHYCENINCKGLLCWNICKFYKFEKGK